MDGPALATRPRPCDVPRPGNPAPRAHRIVPLGSKSKYQQIAQISLAMPTLRQQQTNGRSTTPTAVPSKCPALHRCWLFGPGRRKFRITCDRNPAGRLDAKSRASHFDDTMSHEPNSKLQRPEFQDSSPSTLGTICQVISVLEMVHLGICMTIPMAIHLSLRFTISGHVFPCQPV